MLSNKEITIINELRNNSRIKFTQMSKNTKIPVSTIFDNHKLLEKKDLLKNVSILKYELLGFPIRICAQIEKNYLKKIILLKNVNSIFQSYNSLMIEIFFRNLKERENFIEEFKPEKVYDIVEELKIESFRLNHKL